MPNDKGNAAKQGIADRAILSAMEAIEKDRLTTTRPVLYLAQSELDDFNLLCYSLGSGRNACVNFATKYLCSLWLHSKLDVRLPRALKPTKANPSLPVEYKLNPEVLASVKAARGKKSQSQALPEGDIPKLAVLYLCKKLLPPKAKRVSLDPPVREGVS
jgi:hypothetical protein